MENIFHPSLETGGGALCAAKRVIKKHKATVKSVMRIYALGIVLKCFILVQVPDTFL